MTDIKDQMRILIVEDEPVIRTDIKSLLKSEGYIVQASAASASQALDALSAKQCNFAILDIHLGPGDTGIDVAEVIHRTYQIPYIFLTSFSDPDTLAAAQEQAPYGYLVKPFQDRTLLTTMTTAWHSWIRMQQGLFNLGPYETLLTDQEKRIVRSLTEGLMYKEICGTLDISLNTLKYHVKNIYAKCQVQSRSELMASLIR